MTSRNEVLKHPSYMAVLDHGFVGLVDTMPGHLSITYDEDTGLSTGDKAVVQAARVSYGSGTTTARSDVKLIRYLMKHRHTSPFEMVEFKFHMKVPIFVARQIVRHRTASINEYSGRYSEMTDEFYIPHEHNLKPQSMSNNQGSDGYMSETETTLCMNVIKRICREAYDGYLTLLNKGEQSKRYNISDRQGLSRELARSVLPVNNYTEFYWKMDLHNLFHFLHLRMDSHTQYETRTIAETIYELSRRIAPISFEAFSDYVFGSVTLSRGEQETLEKIISLSNEKNISFHDAFDEYDEHTEKSNSSRILEGREWSEFKDKWGRNE